MSLPTTTDKKGNNRYLLTETEFNNTPLTDFTQGDTVDVYQPDGIPETDLSLTVQNKINYKPNSISDTTSTTVSIALESNIDYKYTQSLTSLTISTFTANTMDSQPYWSINFKTGSTFTASFPNGIKWLGGTPTFEANSQYTIIVKQGLASGEYLAAVAEY